MPKTKQSPKKKAKRRTKVRSNFYSAAQREVLERFYQEFFSGTQERSNLDCDSICREIGLSRNQVRMWIKNRRQRGNYKGKEQFSVDQVQIFESYYRCRKYPTKAEKETLSEIVGVSIRRIQKWFQTRRDRGAPSMFKEKPVSLSNDNPVLDVLVNHLEVSDVEEYMEDHGVLLTQPITKMKPKDLRKSSPNVAVSEESHQPNTPAPLLLPYRHFSKSETPPPSEDELGSSQEYLSSQEMYVIDERSWPSTELVSSEKRESEVTAFHSLLGDNICVSNPFFVESEHSRSGIWEHFDDRTEQQQSTAELREWDAFCSYPNPALFVNNQTEEEEEEEEEIDCLQYQEEGGEWLVDPSLIEE